MATTSSRSASCPAPAAKISRLRRTGNHGLTWVANRIFGTSYTDITFGYNGYWRLAIRDPRRLADGFEFEIQAAVRAGKAGLRTAEIPTYEDARIGGQSKLHAFADGWAILSLILAEAHPRRVTELRSVADFYVTARPRTAASLTNRWNPSTRPGISARRRRATYLWLFAPRPRGGSTCCAAQ